VIEQVGTYDPVPNKFNQQMVSLNYERIRHWLGSGAHLSRPVGELLGVSGFLPIYPKTYMHAWKVRKQMREMAAQDQSKETAAEPATS
jgi:small subunit ribosomal protein S16